MKEFQSFTILGIPKAQGRPRFARIGNHVRAFDPKESREHKANIAAQIVAQRPDMIPAGSGIQLNVQFVLPRPKGHFGAKGVKQSAPMLHTSKPDLDNMLKALKDACKGILWVDDSQVCAITAQKVYGINEAKTIMEVTVR